MNKQSIIAELEAFLLEAFPHPDKRLASDTDLMASWFVDSFGVVETIVFLEENFSVKILGRELDPERFRTMETLAELVIELKGDR